MKTNKKRYPSREKISGLAAAVSIALTAALLCCIVLYGGVPRKKVTTGPSLGVVERFYMNASNAVSDAAAGIRETEKKYWISGGIESVPKPNRKNFGQTDDPAVLTALVEEAEKLLQGQTLYFSPDISPIPGTNIRYYLDQTILVITWKQELDNTVYTFSEVKIADPSQFRRYLAGGEFGSGKRAIPTELANEVHSVVASSGDYYSYRNAGVIVYEGEVCRVNTGADTCYIDRSGNLHFTRASQRMTMDSAREFVQEHDIWFSLAFGPVLVENWERVPVGGYPLGEVDRPFARAALCQMDDLHYLLVNANAEEKYSGYPTMYEFGKRISETGCRDAYALDGGQTATIIMDGELINQMTKGYQRKISDIIYFATALPNS